MGPPNAARESAGVATSEIALTIEPLTGRVKACPVFLYWLVMAFTSADLDAIDTAMVTAAIEGIASVSIAGQSVTAKSLDELRKLRDMVKGELAADADLPGSGLRMKQIVPVYY